MRRGLCSSYRFDVCVLRDVLDVLRWDVQYRHIVLPLSGAVSGPEVASATREEQMAIRCSGAVLVWRASRFVSSGARVGSAQPTEPLRLRSQGHCRKTG